MLDFKSIAQVSLPLCQESQEFYIFLLNVKIRVECKINAENVLYTLMIRINQWQIGVYLFSTGL